MWPCELFSMIPPCFSRLQYKLLVQMKNYISSLKYHRIFEWRHFNFISCLRQLFYVTQIDDLFRFVTNLLSRRDSICIYFFLGSFLFFFFELERHFEGQDFWLKFFSWRSVYLISSIRYQFDPDIWCRFYWFCYLFLFFRNKIGIFWFLCHYGAILGLKILFWI